MLYATVLIWGLWSAPSNAVKPDVYAETPPPTAYDLAHKEGSSAPEDASLTRQIGRSLLALMFVLCLIYVLGKVVLPKVMHIPVVKGQAKNLRLEERLLLDGKNALYLVQVDGRRVLLGSGPQGIRMLMPVDAVQDVVPHTDLNVEKSHD